MLQWYSSLAIGCIAAGSIILSLFLCTIRSSTCSMYQEMMHKNKETLSLRTLERYPTYQVRKNTQKEIWKPNRSALPWMRLKSNQSKLTLKQKKNQLDIVEEIQDISCSLQKQDATLKCFANSGSYYYPNHQLLLNQVDCAFPRLYHLKADQANYDSDKITFSNNVSITHPLGLLYANKATVDCISDKTKPHQILLENGVHANMKLPDKNVSIQSLEAECLLAPAFSLLPSEEIRFSKTITIQIVAPKANPITVTGGIAIYKLDSFTVYPEFPQTHCRIDLCQNKSFSLAHLEAEKIQFQSNKKQILCHHTKGFITVDEKPGFLVADHILFDTEKNSFILSSNTPQKVLFWQDGFSLSAPQIQINKNPTTKKETVQGIGDTRFQLTKEEQTIINTIISKYL